MKGIVVILEVMLTGLILVLAFLHFFPQYSIKTEWDNVLLGVRVRDTLNTIDRLNKTYDLATNSTKFNEFMANLFPPEQVGTALIWWKQTENLTGYTEDTSVPYFTKVYKESMVDVVSRNSSDLVAYYKLESFNSTNGTADYSGHGNDGVAYNFNTDPASTVSGRFGNASEFDGSDDYIQGPASNEWSGDTSFTVVFWMIYYPQSERIWIMDVGNRSNPTYTTVHFLINTSGNTQFGFWNGVQNIFDISSYQGQWVFVTTTYDSSTKILNTYLNASLIDQDAVTGTVNLQPYQTNIGLRLGSDSYFKGTIDEVQIWNRSLPADEIKEIYESLMFDIYSFTLGLGYPY